MHVVYEADRSLCVVQFQLNRNGGMPMGEWEGVKEFFNSFVHAPETCVEFNKDGQGTPKN